MSTVLQQIPNSLLLTSASQKDALDLAARLFGPNHLPKILSGNHPDIHLYIPEGKSGLHPVSNMQKIVREAFLPPFEAKSKIFIIDEAEKMLPAASNTLLKTLEEPLPDTYFFLLSHFPDRLLTTILSRLHPIQYAKQEETLPNVAPLFALAKEEKWDEVIDQLAEIEGDPELYFQSFLHYAQSTKDPEFFALMTEVVAEAKKAIDHNVKLEVVLLQMLIAASPTN